MGSDWEIFYILLRIFIWPLLIIGGIIYFVRRRHKKLAVHEDKEWYLRAALSREDAISQFLYVLSVGFAGTAMLALNQDLGGHVSWRLILLATTLLAFGCAYYFKILYTLPVALIGGVCWWIAQMGDWTQGSNGTAIQTAPVFFGMLMILLGLYALGGIHDSDMRYKRYGFVYTFLGLFPVTIALFFLSTRSGLSMIQDNGAGVSIFGSWKASLLLLAVIVGLAVVLMRSQTKALMHRYEMIGVAALALMFLIFSFLPQQMMFEAVSSGYYYSYSSQSLTSTGVTWAVFLNLLAFAEIFGLIMLGYIKRQGWLINLGAVFMFILVIVKYFDWFFQFLDKSLFFIGAGILMLAVGWFMEKSRRYMIASIKQTQEPNPIPPNPLV